LITYQDHRPKRIPDDEEGQAEEGSDIADVELLHHAIQAGGVDCGADVDGDGEEADLEGDEDFFGAGPVSWVLLGIVSQMRLFMMNGKFIFMPLGHFRASQ
jgi:hypothetical protein